MTYLFIAIAAAIVVLLAVMQRRTQTKARLLPEALFAVDVDADGVRLVDPAGRERRASWSSLERLVIHTTDAGPFVPDVFWEVQPIEEPALVFPGGATGEAEFLRMAQEYLSGFRNDQVVAAMSSTSNRELVVWERDRH